MIIKLPETQSTNIFLNDLSKKQNLESGTVVIADIQTNGKGQYNNYWESEPYKNLTFSIFYNDLNLEIDKQFYISIAVSLGIIDFLKNLNINAKIKWPNDIYINNNKICGILIENNIIKNKIQSTIIGIGLNVNQTKFLNTTKNPTSLKLIVNQDFNINELLNKLIDKINKKHNELLNRNFINLKENYLNNLYLFNKIHTFTINNKKITAKIIDIEENGRLIIKDNNNIISKYFFKEIIF